MNERIKKLWEQSKYPSGRGHDEQKFAELIIMETLQVARAGIEYGDGMEDAVYKYFGIEE